MTKNLKRLSAAAGTILTSLALSACAGDAADKPEPDASSRARELIEHSAKAKAVFVGEIVSIDYRTSQPAADGRVVPFHFVTWRVEQAVRGVDAGTMWTGRFAGGPFGDGRTLSVSEVPELEIGQRALLLATDGDAGACALAGCRDGMLLVSDKTGTKIDRADLDQVIESLDRGPVAARARSADPRAPFAFEMPVAARLQRPAAAAPIRPQPHPTLDADAPELDAFEANGKNPVLR
ncbi:MAG: hypothetical protein JNL83_34890 [Myxococcales bacterium]|nr:hypothetical protein [Myxococcales bacterium]